MKIRIAPVTINGFKSEYKTKSWVLCRQLGGKKSKYWDFAGKEYFGR